MFHKDFYPTPGPVIDLMLEGENVTEKICYDPEGGKGDIIDRLFLAGAADVITSEINADLRSILEKKCKVIGDDFLKIESHQISHVDYIFMNPPFSADEKHIIHAFDIAPPGCRIVAICNAETCKNRYTSSRVRLSTIIEEHGTHIELQDYFKDAERKTNVEISLVRLQKPGARDGADEFEGFLLDEEPEEQGSGIIQYDFIRDIVNRYVASVKIYDKQLDAAVEMANLTEGFFHCDVALSVTHNEKQLKRNEFKKEMQKSAWNFIFSKLNMEKYTTKGLKEDINKFVEKQHHIPFTMHNVYQMLRVIVGTHSQRMDKALLEVFDKLTMHTHENRYNVEGWKTNSHYLINEKFIMPHTCNFEYGSLRISVFARNYEVVDDMQKALCYITGKNYDECESLWHYFNAKTDPSKPAKYECNTWYDWGFFEVKGFKKGTLHFKFKSRDVWALYNQHIARLKGYPLFEAKKSAPQPEKQPKQAQDQPAKPAKVLFSMKVS